MRGRYADTWDKRPDPVNRYEDEALLKYFRGKAPALQRLADANKTMAKPLSGFWFRRKTC